MHSSENAKLRGSNTNDMKKDKIIFDLIEQEHNRQEHGLELIASENFVSKQVMKAQGSVLTNKYAEGLPGKRYYGGCEVVDVVEQLAIDRLKEFVWCCLGKRSTTLRCTSQCCRHVGLLKSGR